MAGTRAFRTVEEWKHCLMQLPDSHFYELVRSVFAPIKTPFNKQHLIAELVSFLCKKEIQHNIAAFISASDAKIITAIAALQNPEPAVLERFFEDEFTPAQLHSNIVNLEERFIMYRYEEKTAFHCALNPLLEPILAPCIGTPALLFPGFPCDTVPPPALVLKLDDRVLTALFNFIDDHQDLLNVDGRLKKKTQHAAAAIFPGLNVAAIIAALQDLRLFQVEQNDLRLNEKVLAGFKELSPLERLEYCAAGVYRYIEENVLIERTSAKSAKQKGREKPDAALLLSSFNRIPSHKLANCIHTFLDFFAFTCSTRAPLSYQRASIKRFLLLFDTHSGSTALGLDADIFLEALCTIGLLYRTAEPECFAALKLDTLVAPKAVASAAKTPAMSITMESTFSFIVFPEISFEDLLCVSSFCSVKSVVPSLHHTLITFEITRQSIVRGFNKGIAAKTMLDTLDRLSLQRLDPALAWTVTDWSSRYADVAIHEGIILKLSPERQYILEKKGPLQNKIAAVIAPGVYLLSVANKAELVAILEKAGIDIIAAPQHSDAAVPQRLGAYFMHLGPASSLSVLDANVQNTAALHDSAALKEHFKQVLADKHVDRLEQDELLARIERGLIVTESQLEQGSVRLEKLQARGLDYGGKAAIARSALESKSLLEVSLAVDGTTKKYTGIPLSLEKVAGEMTLILKTTSNEQCSMPLAKISLIKRIKQSIFEQ
ncbi:hypothetical protein ACYULU_02030 [Breznakiellaceae bacterium SP9]